MMSRQVFNNNVILYKKKSLKDDLQDFKISTFPISSPVMWLEAKQASLYPFSSLH